MIAAVHYFNGLHLKMKVIHYKIHYHNLSIHNLGMEMNMTEALSYVEVAPLFKRREEKGRGVKE